MSLRHHSQRVHWQAPTLIILSFIAGLAFALGHHVFYLNLDGQPLDNHLFDQQTNLAAGHTFAFLVRACLCVAVGAAFWQVFWGMLLRGTFAISHVDALAGLLSSVLDMINFGAVINRPALLVLALLSWMIPLASILPPATLSVQITTAPEFAYPRIPVPYFVDTAMASTVDQFNAPGVILMPDGSSSESDSAPGTQTTYYTKPARHLSRLATSTAFRGALPFHQTMYPNSTYDIKFVAPAMKCQSMDIDLLQQFNRAMNCSFAARKSSTRKEDCVSLITYVSWIPNATSLVPFDDYSILDGYLPIVPAVLSPGSYDSRYVGGYQDGPASIFVASRVRGQSYDIKNWNVYNCSIYNASYSVNVTSDGDSRGTSLVTDVQELNSVPFDYTTSSRDLTGNLTNVPPTARDSAALGYLALTECIGRLLVGTIFGTSSPTVSNHSYYDEKDLATQNEGLSQTLLPFSAELLPFQGRMDALEGTYALDPNDPQWTIVGNISEGPNNWTLAYPKEAFQATTFNRSLGRVIEELFQNMTLSLLSDSSFLEAAAGNSTVEYTRMQNTYKYNSKNLLLSYSLALGFALIAVIAGCVSICYNGASYSNRFSTILRVTRGQNLEELVALNDRKGADPLPKYLAKARIRLGDDGFTQGSDGESQIQLRPKSEKVGERTAMMELHHVVSERSVSVRSRGTGDDVSEISQLGSRDARSAVSDETRDVRW